MRHGMQCERVQTFERSERGLMMIVVRPKPHIMIYKQPRLMPKKLPTHSFGCLLADWYEDWGLGGDWDNCGRSLGRRYYDNGVHIARVEVFFCYYQ